jgi:hypothetical protein
MATKCTADDLTSGNILWTDEASLFNVHLMHGIIVGDIVVMPHLLPEDIPLAVKQRSWF